MLILGINYLSESSVCLIKDGNLKYALSEERINRKKNWYGIPYLSINKLLKDCNLKINEIDYITTHGISALNKKVPNLKDFEIKKNKIKKSFLNSKSKKFLIKKINERMDHEKNVIHKRTLDILKELKKKFKKIEVYDHHKSHAASAYYFSNFNQCYSLTIDGWGDDASSKLFYCSNGEMKEIRRTPTIDSLGYFYGSITKLLGFTPHKHEGKVLGLAAYANPKKAYKEISKLILFNKKTLNFEGLTDKGVYLPSFNNPNLKYLLKKYSKAEIASATQKRLEDVVVQYIKSISTKKFNLALAGGVFSNVKLNQKISEIKNINNIYVFPNMGDGGLSVGSAALCMNEKKGIKRFKYENMYLGPKCSQRISKKKIKQFKIKEIKLSSKKLYSHIGKLLNNNKVIALVDKRMEFGPRALCNRSIICSAKDSKINEDLNKKLKRTEFMPFAPVVLKQDYSKYFYYSEKKHINTFNMTITVKCKKITERKAPAVVHVDCTARPQIIDKKINLNMYNILKSYQKLSKIPILINTSLNVHEEPIVFDENDALRAFKSSNLDYLLIDKSLYTHEN
jgi:carbamoyltransferase